MTELEPTLEQQLKHQLGRYMSAISAKTVVALAVRWSGAELGSLTAQSRDDVLYEMKKGIRLYISDDDEQRACLSSLAAVLADGNGDTAPAPDTLEPVAVEVTCEEDIVTARSLGRDLCERLGFDSALQIRVATVISELARNIVSYAGHGEITVEVIEETRRGVQITARDVGPGIADLDEVLGGGYQSKTGMGIGLLGTKRLMDEFEIKTAPGMGTEVITTKYLDRETADGPTPEP